MPDVSLNPKVVPEGWVCVLHTCYMRAGAEGNLSVNSPAANVGLQGWVCEGEEGSFYIVRCSSSRAYGVTLTLDDAANGHVWYLLLTFGHF